MESAVGRLDSEGTFGTGLERLGIVVLVEVMPPDHTNTERALRLNPREALTEWLNDAAEKQD
jgi:HD-like signal output (HDOD) protein